MARYVTDTHALLWYLSGSERLGVAARQAFDQVVNGQGEVVIPAIVIAEFIRIAEKHGDYDRAITASGLTAIIW